ncbi:alpha-glycosidase [Paenibacillus sp. CN-4]|uniref:alpha-glycosidase n=1 Tax=Paenibacillus nanchangensis TaxID=3348343 RepID=UPI00397B3320
MLLEALYHVPRDRWAYAYDKETVHLRFRTAKNDVRTVYALTGDKYDWEATLAELPMEKASSDDLFDYWETEVRPQYKRLSYLFKVESEDQTVYMYDKGITENEPEPPGNLFALPYIHPHEVFDVPAWARNAVFYQIFPDRFANGDPNNDPEGTEPWGGEPKTDNFFGGDLQGVMDHLDDLVELGVNAIYFTPLFVSPSNHKYDIVDYKTVDPHFGDNDLLKRLAEACHAKGIRVMLDAVFNHCSKQFPPFQDVVRNGAASKYKDWFHINSYPVEVKEGIPTYDTFGFFPDMPKFNTANPEVQTYLLDVAEYWIKEIKLDGWRLDVADEVDHSFWRKFRQVVKAANPEAYIVGEVWTDSLAWLFGDEFDSVMNYPFSEAVLDFFSDDLDSAGFAERIGSLLMRYPRQANEAAFNLLCSHDTPRLLTRLGGDKRRMKLAALFLLTFPGTPCIYYGDEIGLDGGPDPGCRKCMEWDEKKRDSDLYNFYGRIIALRKEHTVFRTGRFRVITACQDNPCLVYERSDKSEAFTVWINNSAERREIKAELAGKDWRDYLTDTVPGADDAGCYRMELEPYGYRILHRKGEQ